MFAAVFTPRLLAVPLAAALCVGVGALAASRPLVAVAVVGAAALMLLPFVAPVTHFTLLVMVAALVPIDLQNRFGTPLLLFDLLLISGLAWAAVALVARPVDRTSAGALGLLTLFLLLCSAQFAHGLLLGNTPSDAVNDIRNVLGIGVLVVALPLLRDPAGRRRLLVGLLVVGLVAGLWGIAQWGLNIGVGLSQELGVAEGVALTSGGTGRVLGGRYVFGTVVILAFAALVSGRRRSTGVTALLMSILVLNTVSLVLAFERTLWLATASAVLIVILGSQARQRVRALVWSAMAALLVVAAMSALAPGQFSVARERLLSVGQVHSDRSVRYRLRESSAVVREIRASPLGGSGLGAAVHWGEPAYGVPASSKTYSHNAYLWLAWKLGIPGLLLGPTIIGFVLLAGRARRRETPPDALRTGAVAGLLAMLVTGATAPVFSTVGATVVIGTLLALAVAPTVAGDHRSEVRVVS